MQLSKRSKQPYRVLKDIIHYYFWRMQPGHTLELQKKLTNHDKQQ